MPYEIVGKIVVDFVVSSLQPLHDGRDEPVSPEADWHKLPLKKEDPVVIVMTKRLLREIGMYPDFFRASNRKTNRDAEIDRKYYH